MRITVSGCLRYGATFHFNCCFITFTKQCSKFGGCSQNEMSNIIGSITIFRGQLSKGHVLECSFGGTQPILGWRWQKIFHTLLSDLRKRSIEVTHGLEVRTFLLPNLVDTKSYTYWSSDIFKIRSIFSRFEAKPVRVTPEWIIHFYLIHYHY